MLEMCHIVCGGSHIFYVVACLARIHRQSLLECNTPRPIHMSLLHQQRTMQEDCTSSDMKPSLLYHSEKSNEQQLHDVDISACHDVSLFTLAIPSGYIEAVMAIRITIVSYKIFSSLY
jgi:hypothetical protein